MPQLKVIQPSEPPTRRSAGRITFFRAAVGSRWKPWATRLYRLAVIVAIVWLVHDLRSAVQRRNGIPIKVEEVRPFLNAAASLERDDSPRSGQYVLDAAGSRVGYALRTSPVTDKITGYVGPTDTLVVLDPQWKVVGLRIRSSQDTKEHVGDVANDEYFMTYWNGKSWDEVAKISPKEMRVEGTSGASLTSLAIAEGLHLRFKKASAEMSTARKFLPCRGTTRHLHPSGRLGRRRSRRFTGVGMTWGWCLSSSCRSRSRSRP